MIGVLVDEVDNSAKNYVIFRELNKIAEKNNCYLFTNSVKQLPIKPRFSIMSSVEALHHNGILIANSIITSQIAINSVTASDKYFYMWELDWMNIKGLKCSQLKNIYYNKEINLIARSNYHYDFAKRLVSEPKGIVHNWNAEKMMRLINE